MSQCHPEHHKTFGPIDIGCIPKFDKHTFGLEARRNIVKEDKDIKELFDAFKDMHDVQLQHFCANRLPTIKLITHTELSDYETDEN